MNKRFFVIFSTCSVLLVLFHSLLSRSPYLSYFSYAMLSVSLYLSADYARFPNTRRILSVISFVVICVVFGAKLYSK